MNHASYLELRTWAYRVYRRARRGRRLTPPKTCERCRGELPRLHGHHDSYAKPLTVRWHCASCHRKIHASWEVPGPDIFQRKGLLDA